MQQAEAGRDQRQSLATRYTSTTTHHSSCVYYIPHIPYHLRVLILAGTMTLSPPSSTTRSLPPTMRPISVIRLPVRLSVGLALFPFVFIVTMFPSAFLPSVSAAAVSPYNFTQLLSSSPTQFSAGVTLGPNLTDPSICNQTRYLKCSTIHTPNVLTVYGAINSQTTANNLDDTVQQLQAVQFYVDTVNAQGGVSIGNVSYLLSFHYQFDDGSENWLYTLYQQWMGADNSHIIYAPIEDELVSQ